MVGSFARGLLSQVMDSSGDGVINFEEFAAWWRQHDVTYVLKRDEGMPAAEVVDRAQKMEKSTRPEATAKASPMSLPPATVVCSRSKQRGYTASDLLPNRQYRFYLRHVSAHSHSDLSPPLVIATPPLPPFAPAVTSSAPSEACVRWYPAQGGALKYRLETQLVELLPTARRTVRSGTATDVRASGASMRSARSTRSVGGTGEWVVAYTGSSTFSVSTTHPMACDDTSNQQRGFVLNTFHVTVLHCALMSLC